MALVRERLKSALAIYGNRWDDWLIDKWENAPDWMFWFDGPWGKYICNLVGHSPAMDHCGLPEHDFCYICHARTPYQAPERQK